MTHNPLRRQVVPALFALTLLSGVAAGGVAHAASGWLGVSLRPIFAEPTPEQTEPPAEIGVWISHVFPESGAEAAGVKKGDRVFAFDGEPTTTVEGVVDRVAKRRVGAVIRLEVEREGKRLVLDVPLKARPDLEEVARRRWVGQTLPETFSFADARTGETLRLKDLAGKPILLEYWATWCGPCKWLLPSLRVLRSRYGKDGLALVRVSSEDAATVRGYLAAERVPKTETVVLDADGEIQMELLIQSVPTMILIDERSVVRDMIFGAMPLSMLDKRVRRLLRRPAHEGAARDDEAEEGR